jgi:hypothetical protein
MSFEIITPNSVGHQRLGLPMLSVTLPGRISLNKALTSFLELKKGDSVTIAWDTTSKTFFLSKTQKGNIGFLGNLTKGSFMFYNKQLLQKFNIHYSLTLEPKASYRLYVDTELPVKQFNQNFYRIKK